MNKGAGAQDTVCAREHQNQLLTAAPSIPSRASATAAPNKSPTLHQGRAQPRAFSPFAQGHVRLAKIVIAPSVVPPQQLYGLPVNAAPPKKRTRCAHVTGLGSFARLLASPHTCPHVRAHALHACTQVRALCASHSGVEAAAEKLDAALTALHGLLERHNAHAYQDGDKLGSSVPAAEEVRGYV